MAKAPTKKTTKPPSLIDKAAKLSSTAKAAIFIVTGVVLGGAFYGLAYLPFSEQETSLKGQIAASDSEVRTHEDALKKHGTVDRLSPGVDEAYNYIQQYLPKENEMPRLVQMVAQIGSRAGLVDGVTLFRPQLPAVVKDNYAEIPFTLNLQGEFLAVLTFLYDFSRMNRIVNITEVNMGQPKLVDAKREIFHVTVKCSGSTYRSLTEEELSAPPPAKKGRR